MFSIGKKLLRMSLKSGQFEKVDKKVPEGFKLVEEGTAKILHSTKNEVFYNNVQVFNRDMSIMAIKLFSEKNHLKEINILEGLAASGLRSIRYWKEIPNVNTILANDLSEEAVKEIKRNLEYNDISEKQVIPSQGDANQAMYQNKGKYQVIDLDPYGSATPFLDAALQSIQDGGLLLVTCTDMQVLAGSQMATCFSKYGSVPLKTKACHEMALRILLSHIHHIASKHGKYIIPLLSCSIDFYIRSFIKVVESPKEAKIALTKVSQMFKCTSCESFHLIPYGTDHVHRQTTGNLTFGKDCEICGGSIKMGGPYWNQPIQDKDFALFALDHVEKNQKLYSTHKRMISFLTLLSNELPTPFFYDLPTISSKLKVNCIPNTIIRSAILNSGFKYSYTHCDPNGIKTDAPVQFLYEANAHYHKEKNGKIEKDSLLEKMLNESKYKFDFKLREETKKDKEKPLFLPNPEPNWGPKSRAKKRKNEEVLDEKNKK